ncbi:putative phage repressor [Solidesulfovibrio fructosivorans JJ]]|uniref:Putative phage repressor n=1 Tax=Solidesulfovibrio fructosivorans JJ] TaxID=596151 RepID=E1JR52_SOLFR|nr:XRE family transcriptional regulator [Solidesulfovibrio fructosivorans]EFL53053.1 putative phage repressor [Solidesulfovibrio fructosivorans JJ]]
MKPDTFEDAYARIQAATKTRTQTEIANLLGIKQSSISDAKKKNTIPDGWLITLYRACGLEPDWILYGQEPASRRAGFNLADGVAGVRETANEYAAAPMRATVYAMARTNSESGSWIRESLESIPLIESLSRPHLLVVKMDNAGMEPVIRHGAYVGIDCDDVRLRTGEIYALDFPGEGLVIKRVVRDLEAKRLSLLPDNPSHPAQHLPLETPGITPIGKAVWVIQEI